MECKNSSCRYHISRPQIRDLFNGGKIRMVQGCRYGYCRLSGGKNMKKK